MRASEVATILLMVISAVVTLYIESVSGAWKLLMATGAGTGGALLARWDWWRVNAWSEVSAMIAAFVTSLFLQLVWKLDSDKPNEFAWLMIITTAAATVVWVTVTLLTKPEPEAVLLAFYRRTRPSFGWGPIARLAPEVKTTRDTASNLLCWISGCVFIYGALFGVGKLLFGQTMLGLGILVVATAAGAVIYRDLSRRGWASAIE